MTVSERKACEAGRCPNHRECETAQVCLYSAAAWAAPTPPAQGDDAKWLREEAAKCDSMGASPKFAARLRTIATSIETLQGECDRLQEIYERAIRDYGSARAEAERLREALRAVIERWDTPIWKDTPLWKDAEATAAVINRARAALASAPGESGA